MRVLLVICALAGALAAGAVTLVKDGAPVARIYVGEAALARHAAVADLNYHLKQMSGAELPVEVLADPGQVRGPAIVLGALAVRLGAEPKGASMSKEGFRLLVKGNLVLIGGESDAAIGPGVYTLLRALGCDWVMPGQIGEIIPPAKTIDVPALDIAQAPAFPFRALWYRGYPQPRLPAEAARYAEWQRRHLGGGTRHPGLDTGGHVWQSFIGRHKAEFDRDPTMLALVRRPDGTMVRSGPQIESTHPRVVELFVQDIREAYQKNIAAGRWTKDTVAGFGVGPADGLGYSLSTEALNAGAGRIDPIMGELDRTDELILLCNRILEQIHPEYPNAYVGFYSYSVHADYPARYLPHPNIAQIFAPISFSRFHGLLDPNAKTQAYYREVVQLWGALSRKQGNPLFYRGYNWNLADNMLPYTKVRIWGEELPFYQQQGFLGLNVEATKAWSVNGPSDYVFMRLAWDATQRWQDLLREYCDHAFGKAAAPMERYFLNLIERQHGAGQEAGSYHAYPLIYDMKWVDANAALLKQAAAAAGSDAQRTRIAYFQHGLEALRLYLDYSQATLRFDFAAAKAGYDAMFAHWQAGYDLNTDIVANETPEYLKRFIGAFIEQGVKYSSAPYRLVQPIPDQLKTAFDPQRVGERLQLQQPETNDEGFAVTRTISSTWDAQGLGGVRDGAVWYRHRFRLPADVKGQPIGLFIGGVEDEARVYLNGKLVGGSGVRFSVPFLFDLTDDIRYDGENLLAIQVIRNGKANELGLGGILRPCFLFTGPRLETKAPKPVDTGRVLPGGEVER